MSIHLSDYGKLHLSGTNYTVHSPTTADAACDAVAAALRKGLPIRVRGSGHSLSGMSLPRDGEVLIRTAGLDTFRVTASGRLAVGSGATMWDVRDFAEAHGWMLPVYNGGWAGPTVGGYVNAGGMGLRVPPTERARATERPAGGQLDLLSVSEMHGGFWEHVHAIDLVDGTGTRCRIAEDDPDFPWLFASCGQFGVILEVELKLLRGSGPDNLPAGTEGRVPKTNPVAPGETDDLSPETGMPWLYWFSYLLPEAAEAQAWAFLDGWCRENADIVEPSGGRVGPELNGAPIGFRYRVPSRRFTPPLLYPRHENFLLMGVMTHAHGIGRIERDERLVAAERAFVEAALSNGWSLYAQAENLSRSLDYAVYLGPDRMARFLELKARYDPEGRLNPGEVVAGAARHPLRMSTARKMARAMARALVPGGRTDQGTAT
jgi:hypothetical protein